MNLNHPKLKEYRYLKTLGEGGQGKVIEVQDTSGRRSYALKLLSSLQGERIKKEIKALQQLNHKNIVHIYDADFGEEGAYILMQHMKHGNIQEYTQKHTLEIEEKLLLIQDAADALEYVHQQKFIHRDIKPYNIFVTDDGQGAYACLGDFGVVKELNSTTITKTGAGIGTMLYFPPEVLSGEQQTYQSDIYALGMSMYEIIAGKHAYDTSNPVVFFQELAQKEVLSPSVYDSSVIEVLDAFCIKSIAKNKEKRFDSVKEFKKELKKCIALYSTQKEEKNKKNSNTSIVLTTTTSHNKKSKSIFTSIQGVFKKYIQQDSTQKTQEAPFLSLETSEIPTENVSANTLKKSQEEEKSIKEATVPIKQLLKKGRNYFYGHGVKKDIKKAQEYFVQAAKTNNPTALYNLGVLYQGGYAVEKDSSKAKNYWEQAAEKKNVHALYNLGVLYYHGDGVPKSYEIAANYWRQAAEQKDPYALYNLGVLYQQGKGVKLNYQNAIRCYEQAIEEGNTEAAYHIGYLYHYGKGVIQNFEKAKRYYEKAIEQENVHALYQLGVLYHRGDGTSQNCSAEYLQVLNKRKKEHMDYLEGWADKENYILNYAKAIKYWEQAAVKGNIQALYELGEIYYLGYDVEKDFLKAKEYYEQAVHKGDITALKNLASLYDEGGPGIPHDYDKAEEYLHEYEKQKTQVHQKQTAITKPITTQSNFDPLYQGPCIIAATKKKSDRHTMSTQELLKQGNKYFYDYNLRKAVEYYEQASLTKNAVALYNLGVIYHQNNIPDSDIKQDYIKAKEYYEQAIEKGNSNALYNLGVLYYHGTSIAKYPSKAKKCWEQASTKGNSSALYNLGVLYYYGEYKIKQDRSKAINYFQKAAEKGDADALYNLGILYEEGNNVVKNYTKAKNYYEQAREKGDIYALYCLADLYRKGGYGIEKDYKQAEEYCNQAKAIGCTHPTSEMNIKTLYYLKGPNSIE